MRQKKLINKVAKKKLEGKCHFCGNSDYSVLDCHRIIPGEDGGIYSDFNTLVVCSNCHRRIHNRQIVIDRKYQTSLGKWVVHYWENGNEFWR